MTVSALHMTRTAARHLMAAVGRPTIIRARMTEDENGYKGFSAKEINGVILVEKMVGGSDHLMEHTSDGYFLESPGSSKERRGRELGEEWLSETFRAEFTKACLGDGGASAPRHGPRQTAEGARAAAFFPDQGMTKEEAETFIRGLNPINDAHGVPSRRRYFRPDGTVIAEAEWVSRWAMNEAGSPLSTMSEAEATKLDKKSGRDPVTGDQP